jgi:dUTPase
MKIKIKLTDSQLRPVRNYLDDSGWDLKAGLLCSHVKIQPGDIFQCSSGLSIELTNGWEGQIRGRSSLNRLGIMVPTGTSPVYSPKIGFEEVELLEKTERNQAGFGSTGK